MSSSLLFKLFPPPLFLMTPYAGLDISDDAIKCIEFHRTSHGLRISKYASQALPPGLIIGGDIKDEKAFVAILSDFSAKNNLTRVKVSIPEEKAYLFQTEVPSSDFRSIAQNIDFKLEQNVPLAAADALFQFDLMPRAVTGDSLRASVSVVPRAYIEHYMSVLRQAKLAPVAFEVVPKAIVTAYMSERSKGAHLVVNVTKKKTGLYIVSEGVVCFTSTISWGGDDLRAITEDSSGSNALMVEIDRVYSYWMTRSDIHSGIVEVVVVGSDTVACEALIRNSANPSVPHSILPDIWRNAFDVNTYVPPITHADSLDYAVAAGLAL